MNQRIIFMGTPAFAAASLNALVDARMEVAAVVTAPDRPAGRGLHLRRSAVKERALELGLPILQPDNLKAPAFHDQLDRLDASLYIVVAFRMLPEVVWAKPALGTINVHASMLPDYRGAAPINWAIINGEHHSGVTTFKINGRIDTGDILLREQAPIGPLDNAGVVHDRLMALGADLLVRTVKNIFDGTSTPIPQHDLADGLLHEAPKLTTATCRIDWTRPMQQVHDHVRGLSPLPGAWTTWHGPGHDGKQLKILRAAPVKGHKHGPAPGAVQIHPGQLLIGCGQGAVEVLEVQLQGKRPMDHITFLHGLRHREGITVG